MSSMQAYLAEKYMTGPKADAILSRTAPKKKKRKGDAGPPTGGGAMILDDDDPGWSGTTNLTGADEDEDTEDAVGASDRSLKKRRMGPRSGAGVGRSGCRA